VFRKADKEAPMLLANYLIRAVEPLYIIFPFRERERIDARLQVQRHQN
jgi:hypothetical protein